MTEHVDDTTTENVERVIEEEKKKADVKEEEIKKTFLHIIKSNSLYIDASKIVHWRDPVKSGLIFGIINFFYFLITWGDYTIVTLLSYLVLALLAVCFAYSNFVVLRAQWLQGKKVQNPFVERFKNEKFHISRAVAEEHFDTVLELTNLVIDSLREALYCTNLVFSAQIAGLLYITATVGDWFSGATLFYLIALGFFIWPRLYEEKQKEIDQVYGIAKARAEEYVNLGLSKLPPGVHARFPQLKPKSQ